MATTSVPLVSKPSAIAHGPINIDHPQLRDLLVCPHEQGVVTYLKETEIVEQNLNLPNAPIRTLSDLVFTPSSLTAMALGPNDEHTLLAAGGSWNADLHLSYHKPDGTQPVWKYNCRLPGTLNNSVLLTRSCLSSSEPRVGITNNDHTFRMYDCAVRRQPLRDFDESDEDSDDEDDDEGNDPTRLECVGSLKLDTCANYAALSPNGRMLITVGDSPSVYLHHLTGSSKITFHPTATIPLPLPTNTPPHYPTARPSTFTACFATAWSNDGSKYAVGSQEGVVTVWDIRSTKPLKVFQVDKTRGMGPGAFGAAAGWISWDPSDWFMSSAPSWSVRNVKFGGDENGVNETLVFTEHTSLVHVVDSKTFEGEQILQVPARMIEPEPTTPPFLSSSSPPSSPLALIQLDMPPVHVPTVTHSYQYPEQDEDDRRHSREGESAVVEVPRNQGRREPGGILSNGHFYRKPQFEYRDDLDLAGLCFDPTGKSVYVGSGEGVVEWGIQRS